MSHLSMTADHRLGKEEAERRLKDKLRVLLDKYGYHASGLEQAWTDGTLSFRFSTRGMHVNGTMQIGDRDVRLSADVPFTVVIFRKRIEGRIRSELGELLS